MLGRVVVERARGFFRRAVRRVGADFFVSIISSRVGPAQMGPFACEEGWGVFLLQCNLEKSAAR
jgi:hypothetical protein